MTRRLLRAAVRLLLTLAAAGTVAVAVAPAVSAWWAAARPVLTAPFPLTVLALLLGGAYVAGRVERGTRRR